jgi:hypothetical protein
MSEYRIDYLKYSYNMNTDETSMYIFEVIINKQNNTYETIRKIKKNIMGKLLTENDLIDYDEVKNMEIQIMNIDNPENIISLTINFNQINNIICTNNIYLEFNKKQNYLECKYNILRI